MARLWSSGFELQSTTLEWETTTGSPSINTTTKRSGAASLRCNPSSASAYLRHSLMTGTTTSAHVYLRAYVYIATLPSANTMLMGWMDNSPFGYGVRLRTDGKLQIGGTNSVLIGTASTNALSTGQWYRIELDYDDGADVATAYVNGVSYCTLTGADTFGGTQAMFGLFDSCTADVYFDDIAVNDSSGSVQNGLPGAGSIVYLRPNAQGDNNGFATVVGGTAGTANNYTRVSETTPDDATTYNNTTATGTTTIDDFNVTNSSTAGIGASDTVTLVQVGQRAGSNAATAASIVTRIKAAASGTVLESSSIPVNVNGWSSYSTAAPYTYKLTAYVKPSSTAWTPSDLDTMQIGYRGNTSQSTQRRVTTIWALVEYVPANTDVTTSGTGKLTITGTSTKTTERITSGTGKLTLTASAETSNPANTRTTSGTGALTITGTGTTTTNRTTARTAKLTLSASAIIRTGSGTSYVWAHDMGPAPIDLELTVQARRTDDWRPTSDETLMSKWVDENGRASWRLFLDADGDGDPSLIGRPLLAWSATGNPGDAITAGATSRPPIDALGTVTLRVFLDVNNGSGGWSVTFETQDQSGAWVRLGDVISGSPTTSIYNPVAVEDFEIGAHNDGEDGNFTGRMYYAQIRDGRTGTILADPDFTIWPSGTHSFSDTAGQDWTVEPAARLVSAQTTPGVAIVGPLETGECVTQVDYTAPRTGIGNTCEEHPDPCCSHYRIRTVARLDGALVVSEWVNMTSDDACLTWDDDYHLLRTEGSGGPMWAAVGGMFTWDRDRPFTSVMGVSGTQFVTSAPPGGRNLHLATAVESLAELRTIQAILDRPLVLVSPSDAAEVWAAPVASSVRLLKIGRTYQITADFIATGPEPTDYHADVRV